MYKSVGSYVDAFRPIDIAFAAPSKFSSFAEFPASLWRSYNQVEPINGFLSPSEGGRSGGGGSWTWRWGRLGFQRETP